MKNALKLFSILILLFIGLPAYGQTAGIRVSPHRIEETVDPGDRVQASVSVTNLSTRPQTFYTYLRDFSSQREDGEATLYPPGSLGGVSLTSWIDITDRPMQRAPGERRLVPVTFTVPEDTGPGGYYGAIIFGPQPPERTPEEGGAILTFAHQAGVLALFNVTGEADEDARLREFSVDRDFYDAPFNVSFSSRVENTGNVHIKPTGSIRIEDFRGNRVDAVKVNLDGGNVLPGGTRRFRSVWRDDFGIGRYTAYLTLTFGTSPDLGGSGIRTLTGTANFWIIPWRVVIPSLLGFVLLITAVYLGLKAYNRRALKKALREVGVSEDVLKKRKASKKKLVFFSFIIVIFFLSLTGLVFFLFIL